jgi:hypothetical protein
MSDAYRARHAHRLPGRIYVPPSSCSLASSNSLNLPRPPCLHPQASPELLRVLHRHELCALHPRFGLRLQPVSPGHKFSKKICIAVGAENLFRTFSPSGNRKYGWVSFRCDSA